MKMMSETLELRGIANKQKKDGGVYYILNLETEDGTPWQFYAPNAEGFANGMKKGDKVRVTFDVRRFDKNDSLVVHKVEKVG